MSLSNRYTTDTERERRYVEDINNNLETFYCVSCGTYALTAVCGVYGVCGGHVVVMDA